MWDDAKQQRLNDLQRRAQAGPVPAADQRVLDELLYDLERAEWAALHPALGRSRREQEALASELSQLRAQNAVVAALAERYADLLARARAQLAGLTSERDALRREYERAAH
jgi:hypothetical protein